MPHFAIPDGEPSAAEAELAAALDDSWSTPFGVYQTIVILDRDGNVLYIVTRINHPLDGWWQ